MTGHFRIPRGELVRSRVTADPATPLSAALDRDLTGYAVLQPQETLLLDGDARGVLTFADGVPVVAYHTGLDDGGPDALAALAEPGPYRAELYAVPGADLTEAHESEGLRVPPTMPAERLAGDPDLAARTRRAAPAERLEDEGSSDDPVATFLDDEAKVEAIREQARAEARRRAEEWGLDDQLVE